MMTIDGQELGKSGGRYTLRMYFFVVTTCHFHFNLRFVSWIDPFHFITVEVTFKDGVF